MPIRDAAIEGSRLRFRAVMMTSIAFVLGLVPLITATGAAMLSRRAVGTPVFGGMLAASLVGVFVIPMLYVVFQGMRERVKGWLGAARPTGAAMLSRRAVGTPVFGGMLAASLVGIFLIPMLYVVFQTVREWTKARLGYAPVESPAQGVAEGPRPAPDQRRSAAD